MVSKQDNNFDLIDAETKEKFLEQISSKHNELSKRQRDYRSILKKRYKTREDTILHNSLQIGISRLRQERNDLKANISVANNFQYIQENEGHLKEIQCHIKCQDHMAKDIDHLKTTIRNMERALSNLNKDVFELNLKIVPESQHQQHVAKTRKNLDILKNQLEVGIRQESNFSAKNGELRKELENILYDRSLFNNNYTKLIEHLNSDKKYMIDLIEYAQQTFDNCIQIDERKNLNKEKYAKDHDVRKTEMQNFMREVAANEVNEEFVNKKIRSRPIAPLQPKEIKRRDNYKKEHIRKIQLYRSVKKTLMDFVQAQTRTDLIDKHREQSSLFNSYFILDNETTFHITLLNNSVNRLYNEIKKTQANNIFKMVNQMENISDLEAKLDKQLERTKNLNILRESDNFKMSKMLTDLQLIFQICKVNDSTLQTLLGDNTKLTLENMRRFTKLLENRVIEVIASVYFKERTGSKELSYPTVQDITKSLDIQSNLSDIVLTQQCPECAEGEAFTVEDMEDGGIKVLTIKEAKRNLFNKVNQPEMQYRLHSISRCRLPNSRMLTAKRNL